jgi:hypothetical protein
MVLSCLENPTAALHQHLTMPVVNLASDMRGTVAAKI